MDELEVFSTAREISSLEDRAKFLDEACGDDVTFRRKIEALLASWDQLGDFLSSPAPELAEVTCADAGYPPVRDECVSETRILGDFRLVRELGCGGMGIVYEAEQLSLCRRVALKMLPFVALVDPKQLQRFQNEARAAASLNHPSIVRVHSVGCDRGVHYYAMEYIEGQTLAHVIAELRAAAGSSPLTNETSSTFISSGGLAGNQSFFHVVASLGIQAADALEHAHQLGIVHRDIKPSNLMVDANGHLWITDFGLATGNTITGPTLTGDVLGTLRYMSPEQAAGERRMPDGRTDIYSLGVTLYELATLQPAFPAENRQELLRQIADTDPVPPRRLNKAHAARLGDDHSEGDGQGSKIALQHVVRTGRRLAAVPGRRTDCGPAALGLGASRQVVAATSIGPLVRGHVRRRHLVGPAGQHIAPHRGL